MLYLLKKLKTNDSGATAIEYGLIAALVAVALIGVLGFLGTGLTETFQSVVDELPAAEG